MGGCMSQQNMEDDLNKFENKEQIDGPEKIETQDDSMKKLEEKSTDVHNLLSHLQTYLVKALKTYLEKNNENIQNNENSMSEIELEKDLTDKIQDSVRDMKLDGNPEVKVDKEKISAVEKILSCKSWEEVKAAGIEVLGDRIGEYMPNKDKGVQELSTEKKSGTLETGKEVAWAAVNLVPVVGPAIEMGRGMFDSKLGTGKRAWCIVEGGVFLALDLTGVGAVGDEVLKGGKFGVKVIELGAESLGKLGVEEGARALRAIGEFVRNNELVSKTVDKAFEVTINARKAQKAAHKEAISSNAIGSVLGGKKEARTENKINNETKQA